LLTVDLVNYAESMVILKILYIVSLLPKTATDQVHFS